MGKKVIWLFLFLFLFSLTLISASTLILDASLVTGKQGECINLRYSCAECSYMNITVSSPNGTDLIENEAMTNLSSYYAYNYSFCNTSDLGVYLAIMNYNESSYLESDMNYFEITYAGDTATEGQAIIYAALLMFLIFVFIIVILGINQLPKSNEKDEEGKILSITYLKYLRPIGWMFEYMLFVAMLFLSSNIAFAYLGEQLFASLIFTLFRVTFAMAPIVVIVWIIWIYRQMFHDKEMQKMLNRGIFPQGKL